MTRLFRWLTAALFTFAAVRVGAEVPGDANGDGSVTVQDVQLIAAHVLGLSPLTGDARTRADANADGALDVADLIRIQAAPLPPEHTFILPGGAPLVMVKIPHGSFQMGSVDPPWSESYEIPVHAVTIDEDFYMGKFEVTQAQWLAVMGAWPGTAPSASYGVGNDFPAYFISWDDIQEFEAAINALGLRGTFRLPSEAEWEYGARGGTQTRFPYGDSTCSIGACTDCDLGAYAWWCGNNTGSPEQSGYGTKIAGSKLPNPFGLYDTMGNVYEWCEDIWHDSYTGAPTDGAAWVVPPGSNRLIRGGHWSDGPGHCRPAARSFSFVPSARGNYYGFRLVWTP